MTELRCTPSALLRGDEREGTATPVARWLLLEVPGAWGRDALRESGLDSGTAAALAVRATAAGVRPMLIRRPGRSAPAATRAWALVDSQPGREAVRWGRYADDRELLGIDLDADGSPGEPSDAPVYLVCAHGRHDTCCALRGRPVAAALAGLRPEATWECSHTGGDRFAANLVALPHGFLFGHVAPTTVRGIVEAYESGRLDPTWLRGRSSLPSVVQAAQHHARLVTGELGVDALAPVSVTPPPAADPAEAGRTWEVRLAGGAGEVLVRLRADLGPPAQLTCSARRPEQARVWTLVSAG